MTIRVRVSLNNDDTGEWVEYEFHDVYVLGTHPTHLLPAGQRNMALVAISPNMRLLPDIDITGFDPITDRPDSQSVNFHMAFTAARRQDGEIYRVMRGDENGTQS